MSETELPLPSLPTECAASDFILSDYFLTNDLLLPNPQQYKHLSSCWSHQEGEVCPTFQGPSQMTLRFCWPVVFQLVSGDMEDLRCEDTSLGGS